MEGKRLGARSNDSKYMQYLDRAYNYVRKNGFSKTGENVVNGVSKFTKGVYQGVKNWF